VRLAHHRHQPLNDGIPAVGEMDWAELRDGGFKISGHVRISSRAVDNAVRTESAARILSIAVLAEKQRNTQIMATVPLADGSAAISSREGGVVYNAPPSERRGRWKFGKRSPSTT